MFSGARGSTSFIDVMLPLPSAGATQSEQQPQ